MSRSRHTDPKWRIASRNAKVDRAGHLVLPRVVERAPRIGDVHPLSGSTLTKMLGHLPLELWHGLNLIELRPRQEEVGIPFASYSRSAKTIRLFSLPEVLELESIPHFDRRLMEGSDAQIEPTETGFRVHWEHPRGMGFWFFYSVFVHELGHHHRFQYPAKRGLPHRRQEEEFLADRYCYWVVTGRMSRRKYLGRVEPGNRRPTSRQ
jgi:hypothetical protein